MALRRASASATSTCRPASSPPPRSGGMTRRNLEVSGRARGTDARGSLLGVLDRTRTPAGARLLRSWLSQPLVDVQRLEERLDAVGEFYDDAAGRARARELLSGVRDLER